MTYTSFPIVPIAPFTVQVISLLPYVLWDWKGLFHDFQASRLFEIHQGVLKSILALQMVKGSPREMKLTQSKSLKDRKE